MLLGAADQPGFIWTYFISLIFNMVVKPSSSSSSSSTLLDSVHAWLTSNRLTVNPSKTEYLLIGTRQQRSKVTSSSISFQSNNILPSASCRNLGVIFDSELSLKKHISTVC